MSEPMFSIEKYVDEETIPGNVDYSVAWFPKTDFLTYLHRWFEVLDIIGINISSIKLESSKNSNGALQFENFSNKIEFDERINRLREFKENGEFNYFILVNVNNFVFECFINDQNVIEDYAGVVFPEKHMDIFMDWILKDILHTVSVKERVLVRMEKVKHE